VRRPRGWRACLARASCRRWLTIASRSATQGASWTVSAWRSQTATAPRVASWRGAARRGANGGLNMQQGSKALSHRNTSATCLNPQWVPHVWDLSERAAPGAACWGTNSGVHLLPLLGGQPAEPATQRITLCRCGFGRALLLRGPVARAVVHAQTVHQVVHQLVRAERQVSEPARHPWHVPTPPVHVTAARHRSRINN